MSKETTAVRNVEPTAYRLGRQVVPEKYEIKLEPDLSQFSFKGFETVHVTVAEPIKEIVLNALELEIVSASITNNKGLTQKASVSLDTENERVRLAFKETIEPGSWSLQIEFIGTLNDKLHGFYRSVYKDADGNQKLIATTQLEATDARRAFPCWDEPDFKATFAVTLVVDANLTAISNGAIKSEHLLKDTTKKEVVFTETMKMSTYLVAFIVGEFEATKPLVVDGTPIRIYATPGKLHLTSFAEQIAAHALSFFNNYYGIKYPGDKLDFIAIPDFAFGAMENLGAITFRETALLVDEQAASHAELERVANVVSHEIAHMWFGDLTTMKWWNGIWLNEAFANFMEMLAVDSWKPQWKRWETFGIARTGAFATDGLASTRTIEAPVNHPDDAHQMFDVLTYDKGASVLRMLEQYLGADRFRNGIKLYLSKHKYANTETTDLWDAIEESSKEPVRQMMDSWIFQEGYPLVRVESDGTGNGIRLSQQRFLYSHNTKLEKATLFHVPIMIKAKTSDGIISKKVLLTDELHVDFNQKIDWVIVNEGGHGFYRVMYSNDLLQILTSNYKGIMSSSERFNLVSDTWAATVAGLKSLDDYLEFIHLLTDENDKNVWTAIVSSLYYLERILGPGEHEQFKTFVRDLISPELRRLGWQKRSTDDELVSQLRGALIATLGTTGDDKDTQKKAEEFYSEYKQDPGSISPDLVSAILNILAHVGNKKRYDEFSAAYKEAKSPQEEDRYRQAMAAFNDPQLLTTTLDRCLSGEIRSQNAPMVVGMILLNTNGRELAWQFIKTNWNKLLEKFPPPLIGRMCGGIVGLVTPKFLKETTQFFEQNEVKQAKKEISQYLEKLKIAVEMAERESKTFSELRKK